MIYLLDSIVNMEFAGIVQKKQFPKNQEMTMEYNRDPKYPCLRCMNVHKVNYVIGKCSCKLGKHFERFSITQARLQIARLAEVQIS